MSRKADALIVAAGKGERSGLNIPKQFFEIDGKPVLFYTIEAFHSSGVIDNIAVALPDEGFEEYRDYMRRFADFKGLSYIRGGKSRMLSVYNGLTELKKNDAEALVCIHDGVRPFVTHEIIKASIDCAEKYGAALTAVKITDTVKLVENGIVKSTCDRNRLFAAQTPQTFDIDIIKNAYEKAFADGVEFTDDCAVAEYCGVEIHINEGSIKNRKLTVREDFEWL